MSPGAPVPPPYENLRFSPGDIILAHCEHWKRGKIVECNSVDYFESGPCRIVYKYLCGDTIMVALEDTDWAIRPFSEQVLLSLDSVAPDPLLMEQQFPAYTVVMLPKGRNKC